MKNTLQQRQQIVSQNIKKAFTEKFGDLEHNFSETCWPTSRFDGIQTNDRDFLVELKRSTGKVLSIKEVTHG